MAHHYDHDVRASLSSPASPMVMMKTLVAGIRSLPTRERYVAFAGAGIVGAFGAVYVGYLLFGRLLIRAAHTGRFFGQSSTELQYYLSRADERIQLILGPLLLGAGLGVVALLWSLRKTNIFDGLSVFWRGVPRLQKTAIVVLCTMVLVGHLVRADRRLFPFVRWGMYDTRYEPEVMVTFEMYGITDTGERIHINIGRTLPSIRRGAPMKFTQTAERLEETGAATDNVVLKEVVSSVANLYAELNRTTFTTVEVVKEMIYRDAPGVYRRSSHVLGTVPLRRITSRDGEGPAFPP